MTDEYLIKYKSLNRLVEEYIKYGSIVVAYDFDNTIFDFHNKGYTYIKVIKLLRELKKLNCTLVCWSCKNKEEIENYLNKNNVPFDLINDNPNFFKSSERKIYYNALLDDRAGLIQVYTELLKFIKIIKNYEKPFIISG